MSEETASVDEKKTDAQSKIVKEVHRSLNITITNSSTHIFVVAVNRNPSKNFVNRITCKRGIPIGGYVYDSQSDSYVVECSDFLNLGTVPIAFMLSQKTKEEWKQFVAMPESVIKKVLSEFQKNELKKFKTHFKLDEFEIEFIQLIDPNV